MRIAVRVKPGASRTAVGGSLDGALVVRVTARAVEGQANDALLRALADAFDVPRRKVTLVSGASARSKVVDIDGGSEQVLAALLGAR